MQLPPVKFRNIKVESEDNIAIVSLNRPAKRNALNAETIEELISIFSVLPRSGAKAAVLRAEGDHFSAGLDLIEHLLNSLLIRRRPLARIRKIHTGNNIHRRRGYAR